MGQVLADTHVVAFSFNSILVTVNTVIYGKFSQMFPKVVRVIKKVENLFICRAI